MKTETATLLSLGAADPELAELIRLDIEAIVRHFIWQNATEIGAQVVGTQMHHIERAALRALRQHLNQTPNIY